VTGWQDDVLAFWFGLEAKQWWKADTALDASIRDRFEPLWIERRQLPADRFLGSASDALAAIILFDQFPRNIYRGHAEQFATDSLALAIAKGAVERRYEEQLGAPERPFLLMPFQHSENIDDQQRSIALFTALGDDGLLGYARKHHDVIARFGRFPHRNAMLGRQPRVDELAAGNVKPW